MCWRFTVTGVPLHSVTFRNIGQQWHRIAGVSSQMVADGGRWLLLAADSRRPLLSAINGRHGLPWAVSAFNQQDDSTRFQVFGIVTVQDRAEWNKI